MTISFGGFLSRLGPQSAALSAVFLVMVIPALADPPAARDVKVEVDMTSTRALDVQIGGLWADAAVRGENCERLAIEVAKKTAFWEGIRAGLLRAAKTTADAVRDGAKVGGANDVAKVAQFAGEIIDAFDMAEPEAALGQAIVRNAVDWGAGQIPKSGVDAADTKVKDGVNAAKDKLINALFPGKMERASSQTVNVDPCGPVDISSEFSWPKGGPDSATPGGLRVYIYGHCRCNANSPDKLGEFGIILFLPIVGVDAEIKYGGQATDLKSLMKSGSKMKAAIEHALHPDDGDKAPSLKEAWDEMSDKFGKASKVDVTLVFKPRFAAPTWDNVTIHAPCGCFAPAAVAATPVPSQAAPYDPRTPVERACDRRCGDLKRAYEVKQQELDAAKRAVAAAEAALSAATIELADWRRKLKVQQELKAQYTKANVNPREFDQAIGNAKSQIQMAETKILTYSKSLETLRPTAANAELEADKARLAYAECVKQCANDAISSNNAKDVEDAKKILDDLGCRTATPAPGGGGIVGRMDGVEKKIEAAGCR